MRAPCDGCNLFDCQHQNDSWLQGIKWYLLKGPTDRLLCSRVSRASVLWDGCYLFSGIQMILVLTPRPTFYSELAGGKGSHLVFWTDTYWQYYNVRNLIQIVNETGSIHKYIPFLSAKNCTGKNCMTVFVLWIEAHHDKNHLYCWRTEWIKPYIHFIGIINIRYIVGTKAHWACGKRKNSDCPLLSHAKVQTTNTIFKRAARLRR